MLVVQAKIPSKVFPLPGWDGVIAPHGPGIVGGSDLMVTSSGTQPVVSMVSGTVQFLSSQASAPNSGGNAIEIKGIDGLSYYYAHLAQPLALKIGQQVAAGQMLGFADNSGNAAHTAPHLHIGIGNSISTGVGAPGGVGIGFNAVAALQALVKQPSANNPDITKPDVQAAITSGQPAGTIQVPKQINFVPSVPGFISSNAETISKAVEIAISKGLDPAIWLGIIAHESGFDHNAVNPKSGACGLAQLFPCIKLDWQKNLEEGANRLKAFLTQCNGDYNCALNKYSGGGGQTYIDTVRGFARAITTANADLSALIAPGTSGDTAQSDNPCGCDNWTLGPFSIPDLGCVFQCAVKGLVTSWLAWWNAWTQAHVANWGFVIAGVLITTIGVGALINSQPALKSAAMAAA